MGTKIELLRRRLPLAIVVTVVRSLTAPSSLLLLISALLLLIPTLLLLRRSSILIAWRPSTLLMLVALLRWPVSLVLIRRTALLVLPRWPVVAPLLRRWRRRATALSHEWVWHIWRRRRNTVLKSFRSRLHGSPSSCTGLIHLAPTASSAREFPLVPSHVHTSISRLMTLSV
jgi:hypothetical protein